LAATIIREPQLSYKEIGALHGITDATVCVIAKAHNIHRLCGTGSPAWKRRQQQVVGVRPSESEIEAEMAMDAEEAQREHPEGEKTGGDW
jgi:hypothetical protein